MVTGQRSFTANIRDKNTTRIAANKIASGGEHFDANRQYTHNKDNKHVEHYIAQKNLPFPPRLQLPV